MYGDPKVGKSYAALQLALAISTGGSWLGFPVTTTGPVAYIQLDTARSVWAQRLDEIKAAGHQVELLHLADRETLGAWPFDIMRVEHQRLLQQVVATVNPIVVIIDTLKESHQLAENDNTEMQKVITGLEAACRPAAIVLVHHGKKPNPEFPSNLLSGARGAGYLTGKMDSILHMAKKTLHYTGRSIEEGSFKIERQDDGFWEPADDASDQIIAQVLSKPGSDRSHAKELAARIDRSEEASRSLIRRFKSQHPGSVGTGRSPRLVRVGDLDVDPDTGEIAI